MSLVKPLAEIETKASPQPAALLAARAIVQQNSAIQGTFLQAKAEQWPADKLAVELEDPLQREMQEGPQEVVQVARYLADEYLALGDTTLLISRETGRAVSRVTDDDLWQPPPVPREGGGMVQPPKRLKPDLEAALTLWHFDREWERKLVQDIAPTLHPTALLWEQGDPRLGGLTRKGRAALVDRFGDMLPKLLPMMTSGAAGQFLSHFEFRHTAPQQGASFEPLLRCTAVAHVLTGIQDPRTMNLRFDRLGSLCLQTANAWLRSIALNLATTARGHFAPLPRLVTSLEPEEVAGARLWVATPTMLATLRAALSDVAPTSLFPIESAPPLALLGKAGALVVDPDSYECAGRELFGRWEVVAKMDYVLWIDWSEVKAFNFVESTPTYTGVLVPR